MVDIVRNGAVTKDKRGNVMIDITFKSVPYQLYKKFSSLAKSHYNDVYWVTLQDLMRKSEAYDFLLSSFESPEEEAEPELLTIKGETE